MREFLKPHRIILIILALAIVGYCSYALRWDWLSGGKYFGHLGYGDQCYRWISVCWISGFIERGIWISIWLTVVTMVLGMCLAIPIGLAQAAGPWYVAAPARVFCTVIRGTPLLLQLWLLYYGLGSLFPSIPGIRDSFLWPILRQAWPFAVLALTLSVAGYEGEVMRGAFKGVPHGQLEAAKS
ncbi:MAG: ABC transporter permease subunit, partial [Paracoccaceae bacterium]